MLLGTIGVHCSPDFEVLAKLILEVFRAFGVSHLGAHLPYRFCLWMVTAQAPREHSSGIGATDTVGKNTGRTAVELMMWYTIWYHPNMATFLEGRLLQRID